MLIFCLLQFENGTVPTIDEVEFYFISIVEPYQKSKPVCRP